MSADAMQAELSPEVLKVIQQLNLRGTMIVADPNEVVSPEDATACVASGRCRWERVNPGEPSRIVLNIKEKMDPESES